MLLLVQPIKAVGLSLRSIVAALGICIACTSFAAQGDWIAFSMATSQMPDNYVRQIVATRNMVFASTGRGIVGLRDGRVITFDRIEQGVLDAFANRLAVDGAGTIWAVFRNRGLASWNGEKWIPYSMAEMQLPPKSSIVDVAIGTDGNISVLAQTGHVSIFRKHWISIGAKSVSGEAASTLIRSSDGSTWVAFETSVAVHQGASWSLVPPRDADDHRSFRQMRQSGDGAIWLAYNEGGAARFKDGSWSALLSPNETAYLLGNISPSAFLVGSSGGRLHVHKDGAWSPLSLTIDPTSNGRLLSASQQTPTSLFQSSRNVFWLSTAEGFLGKVEASGVKVADVGGDVNAVAFDSSDTMWIATSTGLRRYVDGEWKQPSYFSGLGRTLAMAVSSEGDVYIGTAADGLIKYQPPRVMLRLVSDNIVDGKIYVKLERELPRTEGFEGWQVRYSLHPTKAAAPTDSGLTNFGKNGLASIEAVKLLGSSGIFIKATAIDTDGATALLSNGEAAGPLLVTKSSLRSTFASVLSLSVASTIMWLVLLVLYPYSRRAQAVFYWSPAARRWLGLGVVDALLQFSATVRDRILKPFRDELLSGAIYSVEDNHFFGTRARALGTRGKADVGLLDDYLQRLDQPTLMLGLSGIGKSYAVKRWISSFEGSAVYLTGEQCRAGVVSAISDRLPFSSSDVNLIERLIFLRTLVVAIDGINEVDGSTLNRISDFCVRFSRCRILLTTQPSFRWEPPATFRKIELLPLEESEIIDYLSIKVGEKSDAQRRLRKFVSSTIGYNHPEYSAAARSILSIPFDLDLVAKLLQDGLDPSLYELQYQAMRRMIVLYEEAYRQTFPLTEVAAAAYEARLNNSRQIAREFSSQILMIMTEEKILSIDRTSEPVRYFRHDRIQDFFISCHFELLDRNALAEHFVDPRFAGVFVLLAGRLEESEAHAILLKLTLSAAEHREHRVVDAFVQRLSELGRLSAGHL